MNRREAYQIDLEAIIKAAADRGCLELNAQPSRGWMEQKHLINTRPLKQLQKILAR